MGFFFTETLVLWGFAVMAKLPLTLCRAAEVRTLAASETTTPRLRPASSSHLQHQRERKTARKPPLRPMINRFRRRGPDQKVPHQLGKADNLFAAILFLLLLCF